MNTEYRVETAGSQFIVIDPWGEQVNTYLTEEAQSKTSNAARKKT